MSRFHVVIPARYASTRLPGKPLLDIHGKAMILHVVDRAQECEAETITVATDDERIRDVAAASGVEVVMTSGSHHLSLIHISEPTRL